MALNPITKQYDYPGQLFSVQPQTGSRIPVKRPDVRTGRAVSTPQPGSKPVFDQPLTLDELLAAASKRANADITAESQPILDAQKNYLAEADRRRQAQSLLAQAAAEMVKGLGPAIQQGYNQGASELSSIGGPLSEGVRADLAKSEGANRDFVNSVVQGTDPSKAPDAAALKDTIYGTGVLFPSQQLVAQGLAGLQWGLEQPGIFMAQGREDIRTLNAEIDKQNADYTQKLTDIADKFPELRDQAMTELQKWQSDVQDYKLKLATYNLSVSKANDASALAHANLDLKRRAAHDLEVKLGLTTKKTNADIVHKQNQDSIAAANVQLRADGLKIQSRRADISAQNAGLAAAKARGIDAAASKAAGHLVDHTGQDILDANGKTIPVVASTSGKSKAATIRGQAAADALRLRGTPQANTDIGPGSPGRFLAAPGAKGVFPAQHGFPATTNDPNKAAMTGTMSPQQAVDYLVSKYGITRAAARRYLRAAGWFGATTPSPDTTTRPGAR